MSSKNGYTLKLLELSKECSSSTPLSEILHLILRRDFLDDNILHEFSCRLAEAEIECLAEPGDPEEYGEFSKPAEVVVHAAFSTAINAKRAWMAGKIPDAQLEEARCTAEATRVANNVKFNPSTAYVSKFATSTNPEEAWHIAYRIAEPYGPYTDGLNRTAWDIIVEGLIDIIVEAQKRTGVK